MDRRLILDEENNELKQALVVQAMRDYSRALKKHDKELQRECERFLMQKESTEHPALLR